MLHPRGTYGILELAERQLENPGLGVVFLSRFIKCIDLNPDTKSPWIELAFDILNSGVYSILIGPVEGYVNHQTDRIIEPYEAIGGKSRYPPMHRAPITVKQWLAREMADEIHRELSSHHKIQSLSLSNLRMLVTSEGPGGKEVRMSLGGKDVFRFQD